MPRGLVERAIAVRDKVAIVKLVVHLGRLRGIFGKLLNIAVRTGHRPGIGDSPRYGKDILAAGLHVEALAL